ncbi:hypothetical protein FRC11_005663 [Ceratobasidium sp. 423]|nr:hypothetical protein FRC11_005663 [Ceratobasidium sp. 423]
MDSGITPNSSSIPGQHTQQPGPTATTQTSSNNQKARWHNLERFLGVLGGANGAAIAPLRALVDQLVGCIDIYERAANGQEEYRLLQSELENLFQELQGYFIQTVSPTITITMERLCRLIQQELDDIQKKQTRDPLHRYLEAREQSEEVLACYRRIHGYLQRFLLNINLSMWTIMDDLVVSNRLSTLPTSLAACYNSAKAVELKRGQCAQDTRREVLAQLQSWVCAPGTGNLFWLNGMAGTGKTTIAYSFCVDLESDQKLAASFFCSRLLPECRDVNLIIPSIANQLARVSKPFQYALFRVLEKDPDVHARLPRVQFNALIASPLVEVQATLPENLVVVIDALDECIDKESTGQILDILLTDASHLPLKFLVSSRPEPEIRDEMLKQKRDEVNSRLTLHELDGDVVRADIQTYLRVSLAPMDLQESQIATLVDRSGILFIYAATVVRFIGYDNFRRNPRARLETILNAPTSDQNLQLKEIDQLYTTILKEAIDNPDLTPAERRDIMEVLHTIICAREPLTVGALTGLLKLEDSESVHAALRPLWSVLHISNTNELVLTLHTSFPDYILDPLRSKKYSCDPETHNQSLASLCFDLIRVTRPQFNICGLDSSFLPDEKVANLEERVRKAVSTELFYACQYWAAHLQLARKSLSLAQDLGEFLSTRLLLWMEIMNLKGTIHISANILKKAEDWIMHTDCPNELAELIRDSWRFVSTFAMNDVSKSTPHIYVSMLPFWPPSNPISKHYSSRMRGMIRVHGTATSRPKPALLAKWKLKQDANSASFSFDGTRIVVGAGNKVYVVDASNGQILLVLPGGNGRAVCSVVFSPDGTLIAACLADSTVCVWEGRTGRRILATHEGIHGFSTSLDFSPDSSRIASGSEDGAVRIWDPRTGQILLSPLEGSVGPVMVVAFSPDGSLVAAGYRIANICVWDAQAGQMVLSMPMGDISAIMSISFSFDCTRIVSGSFKGFIHVWDVQTGRMVLGPLEGHTHYITSIGFSPDDKRIVSSSADRSIRLWDSQTGGVLMLLGGHTNPVTSVAFSPDGTEIVSTASSPSVSIWDARSKHVVLSRLEGHADFVVYVDFSSDGAIIISGSCDGAIQLWDSRNGAQLLDLVGDHTGNTLSVALSPNGKLIASGSSDMTIHVRDASNGRRLLDPLKGHTSHVMSVSFSPDSTRLVSGSADMTVCEWCTQDGQMVLGPLRGHTGWVVSVGFSADGSRVVSGSYDKTIIVWSTCDGRILLGPVHGHAGGVTSAKFSPDDAYIASGSEDMTIRIWDAQSGEILFNLLGGHSDTVTSVAFSYDGSWIASGSRDKTICVWDAQNGQLVRSPLKGHSNWVSSVAFSPDGTRVVSGSDDKTVRVHDIEDLNLTASYSV